MSLSELRKATKHLTFMFMARHFARLSTCARRATACILVDKHDDPIGMGYNGVASGRPHCTDTPCIGAGYPSGEGLDKCEAIHAEQNALIRCTKPNEIAICYTTTFPCMHCLKMLLNTSCTLIVYDESYAHPEAVELWREAGRDMLQV